MSINNDIKNKLESVLSKKASQNNVISLAPQIKRQSDPPQLNTGTNDNGNNSLNNNKVVVDTGKNLSNNKVDALSRNIVDPDDNTTVIYVFACFNNFCNK